ncbi:hypothetical protein [Nocardia abscessus]|uniref:hypothetical protein n=1 Tax=Nocardia abscessus TaxID=120957 RepID=UPI0024557701|nr:hypothetical protein [Nocardia abscessus]
MPEQFAPFGDSAKTRESVAPAPAAPVTTLEPDTTSSGYLNFRHRTVKRPIKGGMRFLLYWNPRSSDWFYPVGIESHYDFSPKDEVSRDDVLEFLFDPRDDDKWDQYLTAGDIENSILFCGRRRDSWRNPAQRKGQDYYINMHVGADNGMVGIDDCLIYEDAIRFALRMDIRYRDDSWISDETNTGSIRMQDKTDRRAYMVAVHYGDDWDPFGSETVFRKRSWNDLVNS